MKTLRPLGTSQQHILAQEDTCPPRVLLAPKGKQHRALPASWPPWQLCVFSLRRGVQLKNPFYSIWTTEVGTELAVSLTGLWQAHVLGVGRGGRRDLPPPG